MTKTAEKARITACKHILKNTKYVPKEILKYANTIDGVQYITDGYRLIGLKTFVSVEENPNPATDTDIEWFKRTLSENNINGNETALNLPDKKFLETYIKTKKAERKAEGVKPRFASAIRYNFGKGLPMVNAEYLLDMMNIFPNTTFYANGEKKPIKIEDKDGNKGFLLPLRKPETDTEVTKL